MRKPIGSSDGGASNRRQGLRPKESGEVCGPDGGCATVWRDSSSPIPLAARIEEASQRREVSGDGRLGVAGLVQRRHKSRKSSTVMSPRRRIAAARLR